MSLIQQRASLKDDPNETEESKNTKELPKNWEHAHNCQMLCYRLYYNGTQKDETFPPAVPATDIVVPAEKPKPLGKNEKSTHFISLPKGGPPAHSEEAIDLRRKRLGEIREHLETIRLFEGIVSEGDLTERKRQLYLALPPVPPPQPPSKKAKKVTSDSLTKMSV